MSTTILSFQNRVVIETLHNEARVKELDNGDYSSELNAINQAQSKLYQALKSLELE